MQARKVLSNLKPEFGIEAQGPVMVGRLNQPFTRETVPTSKAVN